MDLCLVLDGQRGDMGVSHETGADSGGVEIPLDMCQVLGTGVDWRNMTVPKPVPYVRDGLRWGDRRRQRPRMGHQSYEPRRDRPWHSDSLRAVDLAFPPAPGCLVMRRAIVVGIDQQVGIRHDHCPLSAAKSSASS